MKPTLNQIEAFYWIARLESFRAAAVQLNLTQPTISLRMRGLEDALGYRVFQRVGRGVQITDTGTAFARRMMDLAEQISAEHARLDPLRGRLRLGAPASFALSCMADLLGALKRPYPELSRCGYSISGRARR
jgi:DNA-binding transcriptional LysR family regulator